jgi:hypothetical protein
MEYPFYRYQATSHAFLARAKEAVSRFDTDGDVDGFLVAAMHLRFGIEARLHEYLDATLKSLGQDPKKVTDYVASKLLKRLVEADPRAEYNGGVRMTSEQSGNSTALAFTPVSRELAAIHGKLGGLLHFNFFRENTEWNYRKASPDNKLRTLLDHRKLLDQGIAELTGATSGRLLSHPQFAKIVEGIIDEGPIDRGT